MDEGGVGGREDGEGILGGGLVHRHESGSQSSTNPPLIRHCL